MLDDVPNINDAIMGFSRPYHAAGRRNRGALFAEPRILVGILRKFRNHVTQPMMITKFNVAACFVGATIPVPPEIVRTIVSERSDVGP